MRTYHWNGEFWYASDRSIWKRVRRWFIWFGGWERYNPDGSDSWQFRIPSGFPSDLQLPAGVKRPKRWIWMEPSPVSLFGHRFTYFGWGWNLSVPGGWMVYTRKRQAEGRSLYISANGTPSQARCWIIGAPHSVRQAAEDHRQERLAEAAERKRRDREAVECIERQFRAIL